MSNLKANNYNSNLRTDLRSRSFKFSLTILKLVKQLPNNRMYWVVGDQLLRSSTSIGANIFEAKSASSKRDFINFYQIALKSANETRYWLYHLREGKLADVKKSICL